MLATKLGFFLVARLLFADFSCNGNAFKQNNETESITSKGLQRRCVQELPEMRR